MLESSVGTGYDGWHWKQESPLKTALDTEKQHRVWKLQSMLGTTPILKKVINTEHKNPAPSMTLSMGNNGGRIERGINSEHEVSLENRKRYTIENSTLYGK